MSELLPEGKALQDSLNAYDREELLYATKYAAEHGELPPGFRKCEECGEIILPGAYHYHEKPATPEDPSTHHLSHVHMTFSDQPDSN